MSQISAAHLPICETYLQVASCEIITGHSSCSLGFQNSKWNRAEHVWVAKSLCIYVVRI